MTKFSKKMKAFFGAQDGAGSVVTAREAHDQQITIVEDEKKILFQAIDKSDIPRMAVKNNPDAKSFEFELFNSSKKIILNLNHPKAVGGEMRVYLSGDAGFRPSAGEYWFLYTKDPSGEIVIGSVDKSTWVGIEQDFEIVECGVVLPIEPVLDDEDERYQLAIAAPERAATVNYNGWKRSSSLARKAIEKADYKCEYDQAHVSFLSNTGEQFVEAHHVLPMSEQKNFKVSLDVIENIVSLCPNCHRAIHHSEKGTRQRYINKLFSEREVDLKSVDLYVPLADLMKIYKVF